MKCCQQVLLEFIQQWLPLRVSLGQSLYLSELSGLEPTYVLNLRLAFPDYLQAQICLLFSVYTSTCNDSCFHTKAHKCIIPFNQIFQLCSLSSRCYNKSSEFLVHLDCLEVMI